MPTLVATTNDSAFALSPFGGGRSTFSDGALTVNEGSTILIDSTYILTSEGLYLELTGPNGSKPQLVATPPPQPSARR